MLTDLTFLRPKAEWPPKSERDRLKVYEENRQLFEGTHELVFRENWSRLVRDGEPISIAIVLNWPRRLSTLWADLLLGETPKVTAGPQGSPEQLELERLIRENNFWNVAYEAAIDVSRYGTGLMKIRYDGRAIIEVVPPAIWYPVVRPENIKEVTQHVLAWPYTLRDERGIETKRLRVEIHERGRIIYQDWHMEKNGDRLLGRADDGEDQVQETGIDDFLIIPVHNLTTSDRCHGKDDYQDLDSVIAEMEVRIAQISKILDKHADPSMYGDESALETDPVTGKVRFRGGPKFFPVSPEGKPPGYISWDGQLDAAFRQLDQLTAQFYALSETSAAAFGQLREGLAESGSALRRLMMAPLAKVNRIRLRFDPAIKLALQLAARLEVTRGRDQAVELHEITIAWQDGLPADETEETVNITRQVDAKLRSRESAVRRLQGLEGEALQEELDRIAADEAMAMPPSLTATTFRFGETEEEGQPAGQGVQAAQGA